MEKEHEPVLLQEVLEYLALEPNGVYIDGTFGRGGHSKEILKRLAINGILIAIDKDKAAMQSAQAIIDKRFIIKWSSFSKIDEIANELKVTGKVDAVLLDLGVSSPQLDEGERGFSFLRQGPLDMRMDQGQKLTASTWLNQATEKEISDVLFQYGEERCSRRIARTIVAARVITPITTTLALAELVKQAIPRARWEKNKHPATRTFQALRIFVNDELNEIRLGLEGSLKVLKIGGRLLVITFHSLEDRMVKEFFKRHTGGDVPKRLAITNSELNIQLKNLTKAIKASQTEIDRNPRARSAKLRVMEKIA